MNKIIFEYIQRWWLFALLAFSFGASLTVVANLIIGPDLFKPQLPVFFTKTFLCILIILMPFIGYVQALFLIWLVDQFGPEKPFYFRFLPTLFEASIWVILGVTVSTFFLYSRIDYGLLPLASATGCVGLIWGFNGKLSTDSGDPALDDV